MAIIGVILLLAVYFTPAVISMLRNDPNMVSLLLANLFLGWTILGWVIVLCLACRSIRRPLPLIPPPGTCYYVIRPAQDDDTVQLPALRR